MKNLKMLLASTLVAFATASCAMASDVVANEKLEAYAHPTMFGSAAQQTTSATSSYVVGGKILKSKNHIGVTNKDKVYVNSWVCDMMSLLKDKQESANITGFNEKMPVLRSELAVILSEGFGLKDTTVAKQYKDISSTYWAKDWIYGALNSGVMIGYPDNNFRPDQPVTKAEVFATIAQLIDVATDKSLLVPDFNGKAIQNIPLWAISATKEVVASQLLEDVPNPDKVNNDEYLSKEQVAYLVGALRQNWTGSKSIAKDKNAPDAIKNYAPTVLTVKIADRLSARTANVGDKFSAKTTAAVTVNGQCFEEGSVVKGEVVEVARPGVDNPGYIKIKFTELKNGEQVLAFPENISEATATTQKNPNVVARLFGAPFSAAGRVVGVVGRTGAAGVNVCGNGLEQLGDNLSDAFVDTLSLQPVAGVKNVGDAFVTVGKGVYDLGKLAVSGTFGVLYEFTDEVRYLIVPAYSNESSLNPGEELKIVF